MGNLFKIINAYYDTFESYSSIIYWENFKIWTLLLFFIIFLYSSYWYMNIEAFPFYPQTVQSQRLFVCIFFELLLLINWFMLMKQRDKILIKNVQENLCTQENNLSKLKKMWISKFLAVDSTGYLEIAEKIDKLVSLNEKNQSVLSLKVEQLINAFFQPESKNRILAMFMGICAAILGLSIASGANINYIFEFYEGATLKKLFIMDFIFSFLIIVAIVISKYVCVIVFEIFGLLLDKLDKNRTISKRRARIFINLLLHLYDLPKAKIRVGIVIKNKTK